MRMRLAIQLPRILLRVKTWTYPLAVSLPEDLPGGNSRVATYYAIGVQKYKAREIAGSNPVAFEWVFVAPLADLYDVNNNKVGMIKINDNAEAFW